MVREVHSVVHFLLGLVYFAFARQKVSDNLLFNLINANKIFRLIVLYTLQEQARLFSGHKSFL